MHQRLNKLQIASEHFLNIFLLSYGGKEKDMTTKLFPIFAALILLAGCAPASLTTEAAPVSTTQATAVPAIATSIFTVTSPDLLEGNRLPAEYTCDGAASTLALDWSGAPAETKSFVVIMHHVAMDNVIHWYWVLYDIPANVTSLAKNVSGVGLLGNNFNTGNAGYAPPCSQGPGDKTYTYTVYALSAEPQITLPAEGISRAVMLEAIQNITLASAELNVIYARP